MIDGVNLEGKKRFTAGVAVVGGGVAGVAAAVAAARAGADVYLIERYGFLGGTATGGLVARFQPGPDVGRQPVIRGIYEEICERLGEYDAIHGSLFDPEMMKYVAFDLCEEADVHLLLHSLVYGVDVVNGAVEILRFYTKQGPRTLTAKTYVDATGDGDVSALAGADFQVGRASDGLQQPMTLVFQLGNIDMKRFKSADWNRLNRVFEREVKVLASRRRIFFFTWREGTLGFVMTHVAGLNSLDIEDITRAEVDARRQALSIYRFFRRHVPGCEYCVMDTASQIGIRESRRVMGDYVLTREDVLNARKFEDGIGCSTSWIDVHNPDGRGVLHELVVNDDWFEIPLRAVVVKGFKNLLVAGRCISATHEAQGAIREMPTCIMTGQGAGAAAALAAEREAPVRDLKIKILQRELASQGVWLRRLP
ncbi:MAG: FAD-dependent oxidoreductase [Candidatus Thorarchaeota archaeon]|jgi:hypothetical protein